jgi:ABC-2 type transport system ATP-binding protein
MNENRYPPSSDGAASAPLLVCEHLTKEYGGLLALRDLNLTLPKGKIIALLGPNGSGKTTLIKIIAGLLVPSSGEVRILGCKPGAATKAAVSYLPERNSIPEWMQVGEAVDYFADFFRDFDSVRARAMLADLGVPADRRIKHLSKGMKEKVQLVLVMSRRAHLYLLDEPISGVDPAARDYILSTILSSYNPEATVLISTHLIADVERILDEFIFLRQGQIMRYDSADRVRETEGKTVDDLFREVFRC